MPNRKIVVEFLGKDTSLTKTAKQADQSTSKLGGRLGKIGAVAGKGFALAGIAAGAFAVKAIKGASDLNETLNKSNVIFGKQAASIDKWAKGAATSMGLSRKEALNAAAGFGDMFKQLGFGGREAAKMSKSTVQLAADLGSFNNLPTEDVSQRIAAAFRGEYDSLQQLIPNINAARVEKEALAMTGKKNAKALTAEEKAAAVLAIVNKDGARAQGDFARTSGGLANQQKILGARFENLKDTIGTALLPVALKLVTWANKSMIPAFGKMAQFVQTYIVPAFHKIAGVIRSVFGGGGQSSEVAKEFDKIRSIFTNFISIATSLWNMFGGTLTTLVKAIFGNVKQVIGGALSVISGIFKVFAGILQGDWGMVWDGLKQIVKGAWGIIKGIVNAGWNVIKAVFKAAGTVLKSVFGGIWNGLKSIAAKGIGVLVSAIKSIPGKLRAVGGKFKDAGKFLIQKIFDGLKAAGGFIGGIANAVWRAIKSTINGLIGRLNRAIPNSIGPFNLPDNPVPRLAKGAIVKRRRGGTLATIGEGRYDEAVIPLPNGARSLAAGSGATAASVGGGGDTYIFNFHGIVDSDGKKIEQILTRHARATGRPLFQGATP